MRKANHRPDENTRPPQSLSGEPDVVGLNGESCGTQPDGGLGELPTFPAWRRDGRSSDRIAWQSRASMGMRLTSAEPHCAVDRGTEGTRASARAAKALPHAIGGSTWKSTLYSELSALCSTTYLVGGNRVHVGTKMRCLPQRTQRSRGRQRNDIHHCGGAQRGRTMA